MSVVGCGESFSQDQSSKRNMDIFSKKALLKTRLNILNDLKPQLVLDYLYSKEVLSEEDYNLIQSENGDRGKATKLLDLLPKCGPSAFSYFKDALMYKNNHPWLASELEKNFKLLSLDNKRSKEEQLIAGGVPYKPINFVERKQLVDEIRKLLINVRERRGWVIIHGMAAAGKSVLASAVAHDVILNVFDNIYWISLGSTIDQNVLLMKMHSLCEKLNKEFRNSIPQNVEQVSCRLRDLFSEDNYKSLIILDNVWEINVLNAFNFGCCVLVTTQDIGIIRDENLHLPCVQDMQIDSGFSVDESLQLLAKYMKLDVRSLPEEAKEICNEFGGVPLAIALMGGQLAECHQDKNRWKRYLQILRRRRSSGNHSPLMVNQKLFRAIGESVTNLKEYLKKYYKYFVIFPDGINVPREVLSVVWNLDEQKVDDIMTELIKKSLATRNWNETTETYFYKIHDLQLQYLQSNISTELNELHKELISSYEIKCKGKWECLPCDGYIHGHLAYHLDNAGCNHLFEEIYFNLRFIIAKLKITGPVDILYDFGKYGKNITNKNIQVKRDFQQFIKSNLDLLSNNQCDIVQLALSQPSKSSVYQQAKQIAEEKKKIQLYLDCRNNDGYEPYDWIGSLKHPGPVTCARFTSGGRKVISCSSDGLLRVWDCYSGKEVFRFRAHDDKILHCDISSDGKRLVTCSEDDSVKVWNVQSKGLESLNGCHDSENSDESPDIKYLRSSPFSIFTAVIVNEKAFSKLFSSVTCCAVSSNGSSALAGNKNGFCKVWKIDTGSEIFSFQAHTGSITSCQFSPVEEAFVTASSDGPVKIWRMNEKKEQIALMEDDNCISSNCFFSDGERLAVAIGTKITLWNYHTKEKLAEFEDPDYSQICSIAVSQDCRYLASASASPSVIVWSIKDKKIIASHSAHKDWVQWVSFAKSGNRLVSASDDNGIIVWNDFAVHTAEETQYRDFFFSHFVEDTITIVVPDRKNNIIILNFTEDSKKTVRLSTVNFKSLISCCALSNDLNKIAIGLENGIIKLWEKEEDWQLTEMCCSTQHTQSVNCCAFSCDSSHLISGSDDKTIIIWRLGKSNFETITCCSHESGINKLKFFHKKSQFASCAGDGKIIVWNILDGNLIYSCSGHQEGILSFDISCDDQYLASVSADKTAKLWLACDGQLLKIFKHESCVRSCCFSGNSNLLITGEDEGIVKVWDLKNSTHSCKFQLKIGNSWVCDIAISANQNYMMTAADSLKLWEINTRQCLQTFSLKGRRVKYVKASPDFKHFISVDDGGHLYVLSTIGNLL